MWSAATWSACFRSMSSTQTRLASMLSYRLQLRAPLWLKCWSGCRTLRGIIGIHILCTCFTELFQEVVNFSFSPDYTKIHSLSQFSLVPGLGFLLHSFVQSFLKSFIEQMLPSRLCSGWWEIGIKKGKMYTMSDDIKCLEEK